MMGHHGNEPFDGEGFEERKAAFEAMKAEMDFAMEGKQKRQDLMRSLLDTTGFRGAIGSYPSGKLSEKDEGAIQFAVGEADGKVVIDFGTSVHWLGMTPQQAADFASSVMDKARLVGRKNGETIAITIGAR
jgi:hypothetical protein